MERDVPTLQEVVNGTWRKEEDLKKLKSELSALERKIQLTLIPPKGIPTNEGNTRQEQTGKEIEQNKSVDIYIWKSAVSSYSYLRDCSFLLQHQSDI